MRHQYLLRHTDPVLVAVAIRAGGGSGTAGQTRSGRISRLAKMAAETVAARGGLRRHLDWKIAVGTLNSRACFRLVGGDVPRAPRTNKLDCHPQYSITLRRAP